MCPLQIKPVFSRKKSILHHDFYVKHFLQRVKNVFQCCGKHLFSGSVHSELFFLCLNHECVIFMHGNDSMYHKQQFLFISGDFLEGTRVDINCNFDDAKDRLWFKALCDENNSCPPQSERLFIKESGKPPERMNAKLSEGMDIDNNTFALIIIAARIKDEGNFTCRKVAGTFEYDPHKIAVYGG